jgi:signal transduction histidine kinase
MATDLLLADPKLQATTEKSIRRIRGAALDMEALIESFLLLAREDDSALPEEDFLVNEVVRDELDRARALVADKPVRLELEQPHRFALHASPRVLSVMLGNLLRNACHYTEKGVITVRVGSDSIEVDDTGVGMSPEQLEHAFDPFFRAAARADGGQGVGLTIVRRLSQRYDWPVTLESQAGHGTRATIRFPHPHPVDA